MHDFQNLYTQGKSTRPQQSHRFGAFTLFHGEEADVNLVATLFNGYETALPAFANAYNTFSRDGRYMTLRRFAMHFLCIHTLILFSTEARPVQTQLKLKFLYYALKTQNSTQVIVYAAQGYSAPVLKAEHLVSCLCVRVRVCGGGCLFVGGGGGCGLWFFFLRYTHVHKRQGLIHRSMAVRPLYPLLLTRTTPSLRDSRYLIRYLTMIKYLTMIRERFVIRKKKVLIIFSVMATTSDPRYEDMTGVGSRVISSLELLTFW